MRARTRQPVSVALEVELVRVAAEYVAARYLADPLMSRAEERLRRFVPVLQARLGDRPYRASDRVTVRALEEAALTDDALLASYLGGVLAASGPEDDTGAAVIAQIGRLSALQLRLHFVLYRAVQQFDAVDATQLIDLRDPDELRAAYSLFIPVQEVNIALGGLTEGPSAIERVSSMMRVLAREGLIASELEGSGWRVTPGYEIGDPTKLEKMFRSESSIPGPGLVAGPTPSGIELFLWGIGGDDHDPAALRTIPVALVDQLHPQVPSCPGAHTLRELAI
jgi:hypothetical protein